ncbi:MAG: ABC transporter ATP-binding protein/permease, partial [Lachnospiraceae bacterium]|nr:ABC transporter ATP-binding protein/permease [Lachnospiraceae bacterium]
MGQIKQGRRIRLRENLSVCFRMTGHLMKASPRFFVLNLLNAAVYAVSNPVQMLLYKKIIDLIVYSRVTLQTAAKYFALYYLLNQFLFVFHYLVDTNFNEREKIKINLYYKRFIYEETGRNRLEYCGDSAYMDRLYSAVHHDGSYLYRFAERLFSLVYSVISLCAVSYIFAGMHPVFPAAALVIAVRDFVLARRKNRTEYQRHTDSLPLERCKTYINNIFCLRDYVRELRMYPIGEYFRRKHRLVHELQWKINRKHQRRLAALEFAGQASDAACRIFNVAVGVALLRAERITVGELGMLFSRFTIMVQCIGDVLGFFPAVEDDARYMREIFETAEKEKQIFPEISPCGEDGEYIQFTGVSYRYHEKEYALSDINVRIPLGRKIAIVGENGSGKSTFVKLLAGLYEPTAGEIAWHCKNAGESCISLFGVMPQDFRIYAMAGAENIYPPFGEGDAGRVAEALDFCGM